LTRLYLIFASCRPAAKVQSSPSGVRPDFKTSKDIHIAMTRVSPWQTTPKSSAAVFLLAVFCVFTSFGVVSDILEMGSQSTARFAVTVALTGVFAVGYAVFGISLRDKFWMALIPLFALQFAAMSAVGHWLPNSPAPHADSGSVLDRLHGRMTFDGVAILIGVALGYTGIVYVFISEGRRYLKAHTEKTVLEGEMAAAREVQDVILPETGEFFPGFRVESVYRPAQQVGGDFFQIVSAGSGSLLVVVGDVAGKGLPAAMLVSMLVGSIRVAAEESYDPARMLRKLHDRLIGRTRGGFCTALAAFIASDGQVTIANAGHLAPYLDGKEIPIPGAFPLGIVSGAQYENTSMELAPGSRLTFYSDGVVEAMNAKGELFGFERAGAISTAPASEIVETAVKFGQSDDITVVTVERLGAN